MDIRKEGFYAYLTLNGKNILLNHDMLHHGSIMSSVSESLKSLSQERSKGEINIILRISNQPIDLSEKGLANFNRVTEIESMLEPSEEVDVPSTGESYEDFYRRLLTSDYNPVSAEAIAAAWFEREVNPHTTEWLNDAKAVRFRELNSRDEAYESALPEEYERLKQYVKSTYPEFIEHLTFRTA